MTSYLPLASWLDETRSDHTLVAWDKGNRYTLDQLRNNVIALFRQIEHHPDQRWALCLQDSFHFITAMLAVLHAGKTPVIPGHHRVNQLREQQTRFGGLITDMPVSLDCPVFKLPLDVDETAAFVNLPVIAEDAEIILFTSGSTGQPKEIHKPLRCLEEDARWQSENWGSLLHGCQVVSTVNHQHLYGLTFQIILPMALSLPLACRQIEYQEQLPLQCGNRRTFLISSPAFLKRLDTNLPSFNCAILLSAGGPLPWEDAERAQQWLGILPHEMYGSTEAGAIAWRHRTRDELTWKPFPGVRFTHEGERIKAHSALIVDPNGLLLDDKLIFLPDGSGFYLGGRNDRIIKLEEKRISLSEIEWRLQACEEVAEAVVLPVSRGKRTLIGAVIVLSQKGKAALIPKKTDMELTRVLGVALRQWIDGVAVPRYWRFVETIPYNTQGKRDYEQLQNLFDVSR